ncbi:hypothetical protein F7725_020332, partial [Dissostichus mawsoni]
MVINDPGEPGAHTLPAEAHGGQSFGFYLQTDKSSRSFEIRHVDPWSPAGHSGLQDGDRVLEVNEEYVDNTDFSRIVRKIQSCGFHLFLLVLRREEYEQAVSMGGDLQKLARASKGERWSRTRLCHISRHPEHGLGMTIVSVEVTGGPAERAGVCYGDRLMWINGVRVSTLTHSTLDRTVRLWFPPLSFMGVCSVGLMMCVTHAVCWFSVEEEWGLSDVLVIDPDSESCNVRRKMPTLPVAAECCGLPYTTKTLHLTRETGGARRIVHVLREIDVGSPAEGAGMEDGDLLLAVNGKPIESMEHEDIVKEVRQSGEAVILTTISIPGRDFYREIGISPLLFYDECSVKDNRQRAVSHCTKNQSETPLKHGDGSPTYPTECVPDQSGTLPT